MGRRPVAPLLAGLIEPFFGGTLPIRIRAWDGSVAGPAGAPVAVVRSRRALRRLLWSPGELGLAQAYVTGELDVEGDLHTPGPAAPDLHTPGPAAPDLHTPGPAAPDLHTPGPAAPDLHTPGPAAPDLHTPGPAAPDLHTPGPAAPDLAAGLSGVWDVVRERGLGAARPTARQLAAAATTLVRLGIVGPRPPAPASQARLAGRLHTRARDRDAISHHYDLSNEFYSLLLDPHMAYSCAYWSGDDPGYTLVDAQRDKLALVCAKLGLQPGMRLLDVGCGWGSLSLYAAEHLGASVVGVTLSERQRDFVLDRVRERGLGGPAEGPTRGTVEIRLQDYRDVADGPFDAAASIEMGEHVGAGNYPLFAARLHELVRPEGRVLIQQMSRRGPRPGGGDFIESFIAPDMHMRPVGETIELLEAAGLEVRDVEAMREHYTWTIRAWLETFESHWADVVALVGEEVARVWRLYLVGSALTFEEGRMGVDQILSVRPSATGRAGMPRTRTGTGSDVRVAG